MISVVTLLRKSQVQEWILALLALRDEDMKEVVSVGDYNPVEELASYPLLGVSHKHVHHIWPDVTEQAVINEYGIALGKGINAATMDLVLVLDDDVGPVRETESSLRRLREHLEAAECVTGVYPPRNLSKGIGDFQAFAPMTVESYRPMALWWSLIPLSGTMEMKAGWNGYMLMARSQLKNCLPLTSAVYGTETHFILAQRFAVLGYKALADCSVRATHDQADG